MYVRVEFWSLKAKYWQSPRRILTLHNSMQISRLNHKTFMLPSHLLAKDLRKIQGLNIKSSLGLASLVSLGGQTLLLFSETNRMNYTTINLLKGADGIADVRTSFLFNKAE